ncbi:MAG: SufE family protein [Bdellovibrionales bacterium]|nr:SufE family protein [Bdellovibrionales bacterium]
MSRFPGSLQTIIDEFKAIDDANMRGELLIEFADKFIDVPETIAKRPFPKTHLVPGCESEAYIWCTKLDDGGLKFHFAVENPHGVSAKSLAVILDEGLSGHNADEILGLSEELVYEIFGRNISMGKGQGLMGMVAMVRGLAMQQRAAQL